MGRVDVDDAEVVTSRRNEAIALIRFLLWASDEAALALHDSKAELLIDICIDHLESRFRITREDLFASEKAVKQLMV